MEAGGEGSGLNRWSGDRDWESGLRGRVMNLGQELRMGGLSGWRACEGMWRGDRSCACSLLTLVLRLRRP